MAKNNTEKKVSQQKPMRNWATIVYPDSAPSGWLDILSSFLVPAFVSPLHDLDFTPMGEPKKPHYHVMVMFEGKKSKDQVQELFDQIGGVGIQVVNSLRGHTRYLCHLDNPEKALYDPEEVTAFCGADYHAIVGLAIDKYKAIREMMDFCKKNEVFYFAELLDYAGEERMDWFRILCDSGAYIIKEYLKSLKYYVESRPESEL